MYVAPMRKYLLPGHRQTPYSAPHRTECVTLARCTLLSRDDRLSSASLARLPSAGECRYAIYLHSSPTRARMAYEENALSVCLLCVSYREFRTAVVRRPPRYRHIRSGNWILGTATIRLALKSKFVSSPARYVISNNSAKRSRQAR